MTGIENGNAQRHNKNWPWYNVGSRRMKSGMTVPLFVLSVFIGISGRPKERDSVKIGQIRIFTSRFLYGRQPVGKFIKKPSIDGINPIKTTPCSGGKVQRN